MTENKSDKKNKLKKEFERIFLFLKNHKILVLILIIILVFFIKNDYKCEKKNILKGGVVASICDNDEIVSKSKIIFCYLSGYNILKKLKEKYQDKKILGFIPQTYLIWPVWFFKSFIYRPIYGAVALLVFIFAITGSFIFPFVIFGILLYYLVKSLFTKYKTMKNKSNKNISNNNNNKNNNNI